MPERPAAAVAADTDGTATQNGGAAGVAGASGAKSTTAKLIETMPTPADQCVPVLLRRNILSVLRHLLWKGELSYVGLPAGLPVGCGLAVTR